MCGITGYLGNFSPDLLEKMIMAISHRGPDDRGIWYNVEKEVGLGHARLSIIDLSRTGHQPMSNEDQSLWLTYNGEIYNYSELQQELKAKGHIFKSKTDSEVLLHLYEEEGLEMLKRLDGIFAFSIYDRQKDELFIAKDALGVKPLYYAEVSNGFLFASELKAILTFPGVSREIDTEAVYQYLTYLWAPAPRTMLKQVKKLSPGYALRVKNRKILEKWQWYFLPYKGKRLAKSEKEITKELAEKIEAAVEKQLVSDVPIGAFLSGGLDSSAVVAMMRKILPEESINCYCIGFRNTQKLEDCPLDLPYARKVAKRLNVNLEEIIITPEDLIKEIKELIFFLDEPQADPAPINAMLIAKRAKEDGIKVLLSGTGGDDIFAGYRRHQALLYEKYWAWLPTVFRRFLAQGARRYSPRSSAVIRRLKKVFTYADQSPKERLVSYFKWSPDELRCSLLNKNFRYDLSYQEPLIESLEEIPLENDPLNQMLYLEAKHFLADHNLNYVDKTSMRYGVEVRVPLLDVDLIEFATQIPSEMKQMGRVGKAIFKKAMKPYLPHDILSRKKTSFGAPLRKWIKIDLKDMMDDLLSEESLKSRGLFDSRGVQSLIKENQLGRVDGAYTIFSLMCIELWCRIFIDHSN